MNSNKNFLLLQVNRYTLLYDTKHNHCVLKMMSWKKVGQIRHEKFVVGVRPTITNQIVNKCQKVYSVYIALALR